MEALGLFLRPLDTCGSTLWRDLVRLFDRGLGIVWFFGSGHKVFRLGHLCRSLSGEGLFLPKTMHIFGQTPKVCVVSIPLIGAEKIAMAPFFILSLRSY